MDRELLEKLIARGEGPEVEFKVRLPSQLRLARSVCAFANSFGGVIIAGVDDQGRIIGVDSENETRQAFHACLDCIEPRPEIRVEQTECSGALLLTCQVARGTDKPYQVVSPQGRRIFIRAGSSVRPLNDGRALADEDIWRRKLKLSSLQKAIMGTIRTDEGIKLGPLSARHNLSRHKTARLLVPLLKAGVVIEKDGGYMLR